ncbi:MAG: hypothetical protein M1491_06335 [Deltaproteobacteria bacterium]|nr:hypothetical protein [Deltaproteobacteria bacterium]MCL5276658.1 hypothetical protein [Deltaproteobacteria bacterium]
MKELILSVCLALLVVSCAAGNNNIENSETMNERYASIKEQQETFTMNLVPPEGGKSICEGRELERPYSVQVVKGKTYSVEIDLQDGTAYKGTVQVLSKGGAVGRYTGYDVGLSRYILDMLKHDKQVSFYINSSDGKQILLVTFYAP